jgi:hypothetical protein
MAEAASVPVAVEDKRHEHSDGHQAKTEDVSLVLVERRPGSEAVE